MAVTGFNLAVSVVALDKFSNTFGKINAFSSKLEQKFAKLDQSFTNLLNPLNGMAAGLGTTIYKAFTENEDALIGFQNSMMKAGGEISPYFGDISKKVEELGVALPGASSDFYKMASALKNLGASDESIKSSLDATAKLAVVLKDKESYDSVAEGVAKIRNAMGIADQDMTKFADSMQRAVFVGGNLTEMRYGFSRMAGSTDLLGWKGIEHAGKLTALLGMLTKGGKSGETSGTALNKIFMEGLRGKLFNTEEGFFQWLEKSSQKQLEEVLGKGGQDLDVAMFLKGKGLKGYQDFQKTMGDMGSLDDKIKNSLGSLTNIMEAMMGTMTKVGVSLGKLFGDDLKDLFNNVNNFADGLSNFIDKHQKLASVLSQGVLAVVGFRVALQGLQIAQNLWALGIEPVMSMKRAYDGFVKVRQALNAAEAAGNMNRYYRTLQATGRMGLLASGNMRGLASSFAVVNPYVLAGAAVVGTLGLAYLGYQKYQRLHLSLADAQRDAHSEAVDQTRAERTKLESLFFQLKRTNPESKARKDIIEQINALNPTYLKGLNAEKASVEQLEARYKGVVSQLIEKKRLENMANKRDELIGQAQEAEDRKINMEAYNKAGAWEKLKMQYGSVRWEDFFHTYHGVDDFNRTMDKDAATLRAEAATIHNNITVQIDGKNIPATTQENQRTEIKTPQ